MKIFRKKASTEAKYKNSKCEYQGIKFDSKKEMERYIVLKASQDNGFISNLELQPKFTLVPPVVVTEVVHLKTKEKIVKRVDQREITYIADFKYTKADGTQVVEDVKGSKFTITEAFKLKAKMMYAILGIKVRIVFNGNEPV